MFRFAAYEVRRDVDPDEFRAFEARVGDAYAAGCRTFGFHSLGTFEIVGAAPRSGTCTHVDLYVVPGDDPTDAEARCDAAPDPEGFAEIIDECRSFMVDGGGRCLFYLVGTDGTPAHDVDLGSRVVVIELSGDTTPAASTLLGRYVTSGLDAAASATISIVDPDVASMPSDGWLLRPVVRGAEVVPAVA